jgi:hypothetical protein
MIGQKNIGNKFSSEKKTQKIYFSTNGVTYSAGAPVSRWFQPLNGVRFSGNYGIVNLDSNNNFDGFSYHQGHHEILDFDSKIKKIELQFNKTTSSVMEFDFRMVLLNYKLPLFDFPYINGNVPYDKLIVFDKTYRMANPTYYNLEINAEELLDIVLSQGSYFRLFFNLSNFSSNGGSIQSFSMTTKLEEV